MKNIHLQHPEDSILSGDLSVLDWFLTPSHLSVKMDGSPAIVWGKNPATGNHFVGTKSVFNKVKIKINESHDDIDKNHEGEVAEILHACFDYLPFTDNVIQGDFIGFGGSDTYTPNTLTYVFDDVVTQNIIVAPHTFYECENDLRDAIAHPMEYFNIPSTEHVKMVQPKCWEVDEDFSEIVGFARQMAQLVKFVDEKEAIQLKKDLNAYIRDGDEIVAEEFANYQLVRLWLLVENIKTEFTKLMRDNFKCDCWLGKELINGEGYVMAGRHGTYKLVDRPTFSHYNFNIIRS